MRMNEFKCMKCGNFKLERPDKLPFCSECERKIEAEVKNRVPKVGKKKLVSQAA